MNLKLLTFPSPSKTIVAGCPKTIVFEGCGGPATRPKGIRRGI
jgi:hypothetical protein